MIDPLTMVLGDLAAMNLGHLVDPAAFAGCWVPRRIAEGGSLSKHTWGLAVDVNIGTNPRGSFSTQDPRLVDLMRSAGFTWGGSWLVPDPGHYELDP
ncbi:MAG: M15 family metallopeptidase [Acidimicrobiia bacterium]|nr:M15 family metallopeptidase [Acidimicrobiia bacterium]